MNILYKLLKQDKDSRDGAVVVTSTLGIIANVLIASIKIIIGFITSSIAIMSEGANNAADALTSILTIVGTKLSMMHPTEKHPFGFGRIEYLGSLIISILISFTGLSFLKDSIKSIFHPNTLDISIMSLIIVAITAGIKLMLGTYTINTGKRVESDTLVAIGTECRSDSIASVASIVSAIAFIIFKINIDGFAGIFISILIIKAGYELLSETISDLLGKNGKEELAKALYKEIRDCDIVLNAADMMLHNYGPEKYSGSCNIEIDHKKTVEDVYKKIHELQLNIMHKYNVTMVFGIYAVDHTSTVSKKMRKEIAGFVRKQEHVISYHALYLNKKEKKIYVDLVVDYKLKDWELLRKEFTSYMKSLYKNYDLELVIETDYV